MSGTITLSVSQISDIFNEWARRYAEDPTGFDDILDENGNAITEYGDRCAEIFLDIAKDLTEKET